MPEAPEVTGEDSRNHVIEPWGWGEKAPNTSLWRGKVNGNYWKLLTIFAYCKLKHEYKHVIKQRHLRICNLGPQVPKIGHFPSDSGQQLSPPRRRRTAKRCMKIACAFWRKGFALRRGQHTHPWGQLLRGLAGNQGQYSSKGFFNGNIESYTYDARVG